MLDGDPASSTKGAEPPNFGPTYVHCGQTAAWIKMPLGTQVGLGLRDIVLGPKWEPSSTSPKGAQPPNFRPMPVVAKRLDGLRCHFVWR